MSHGLLASIVAISSTRKFPSSLGIFFSETTDGTQFDTLLEMVAGKLVFVVYTSLHSDCNLLFIL